MAAGKTMCEENGSISQFLTQTPKEAASQDTVEATPRKLPWGRLLANKGFLKSIDLIETFSFGRGENCTAVVTSHDLDTKSLINISKKHFQIDRCHDDNLTYIIDFSKNGTFINKQKLGVGKRRILKHNDAISVYLPKNVFYYFMSQGVEGNDEFLPKELLDKFANVRQLGRGSCGEVRLVRDRTTFKQFAIKKILLSQSNTSQMHKINHPQKVQNEINILKRLSHPCVIGMLDIIKLDMEVYIVLEYMAGGELTGRILQNPMTQDLAKYYFTQMLIATQYLHRHGVIHRDLKPENMLLLDNGEKTLLKITDFGLSKFSDQYVATTVCGTLRYVAPEVIDPRYNEYGKEVDTWSLGVILYFILSQDFPFKGEKMHVLAANIRRGICDFSGDFWSNNNTGEVKDLLKKMFQLNPQKRISIKDILNHEWLKYDQKNIKSEVRMLLEENGLDILVEDEELSALEDLSLESVPKKMKLSSSFCSTSSEESNETLDGSSISKGFKSCPTICC